MAELIMSRPPSEHLRRMQARLSDGRWHTREELIAVAESAVPFHVALREREAGKARQRIRKRYVREQVDPPSGRLFEIGARAILNSQLQTMIRAGRLDRRLNSFRWKASAQRPSPRPMGDNLTPGQRAAALADITHIWNRL